ncbi:ABC transporter permease [Streptomyces sp. NPDC012510]|uniref:ABC transporter permease n=1 Tax=Streptomyces sp. NPDC012510 TaxID=3364838 RepID=UPI0036E9910C
MSATTTASRAEAPVTGGGRRTKPGPHGLTWALLRLHGWAAVCWAVLVLVTAGALLWAAGPGVDAAWADYHTETCRDDGQVSVNCDFAAPALDRYDAVVGFSSSLITGMPLLVALWAGAALIGRELENGTAQLTWTQSVTPARWLAAKLALPAAVLGAGTLLLVLAHRLMWSAHIEQGGGAWHWQGYEEELFVGNGPLAVARVLLGLVVGALIGLLTRRSMASLGYGFFALVGLIRLLDLVRPYLWPAETVTNPANEGTPHRVGLVADSGVVTADGTHVATGWCSSSDCGRTDVVGHYLDYHPTSHFWPLHLVETGIVLAVTALLVLAAFRLLRRRTGGAV